MFVFRFQMAAGIRVSSTSVAEMESGESQGAEVKVLSVWLLGQLMLMPSGMPSCGSRAGLGGERGRKFERNRDKGERLQKRRVFLRRCGGSYSRSALGRFCLW